MRRHKRQKDKDIILKELQLTKSKIIEASKLMIVIDYISLNKQGSHESIVM